jgi:hypothetical protein
MKPHAILLALLVTTSPIALAADSDDATSQVAKLDKKNIPVVTRIVATPKKLGTGMAEPAVQMVVRPDLIQFGHVELALKQPQFSVFWAIERDKSEPAVALLEKFFKWDAIAREKKPGPLKKTLGTIKSPNNTDVWEYSWTGEQSWIYRNGSTVYVLDAAAVLELLKQMPDVEKEIAEKSAKTKADLELFQ